MWSESRPRRMNLLVSRRTYELHSPSAVRIAHKKIDGKEELTSYIPPVKSEKRFREWME